MVRRVDTVINHADLLKMYHKDRIVNRIEVVQLAGTVSIRMRIKIYHKERSKQNGKSRQNGSTRMRICE